jgi:hypothetical protein
MGAAEVFGKMCEAGDEFVVTYGKTYPGLSTIFT